VLWTGERFIPKKKNGKVAGEEPQCRYHGTRQGTLGIETLGGKTNTVRRIGTHERGGKRALRKKDPRKKGKKIV